jgi:hypothetical protein
LRCSVRSTPSPPAILGFRWTHKVCIGPCLLRIGQVLRVDLRGDNITKPSSIGYGYEEVVKLSSMNSILSKSLRTSTSIWAGGSPLYQEIWPDWLRSFECALASTRYYSHYKTSQILLVTKKIDHCLFSHLYHESTCLQSYPSVGADHHTASLSDY